MKSFDDFLNTITHEDIEHIAEESNEFLSDIKESDPSSLGHQIYAVSHVCSIELLRLYHKWLQQELSGLI